MNSLAPAPAVAVVMSIVLVINNPSLWGVTDLLAGNKATEQGAVPTCVAVWYGGWYNPRPYCAHVLEPSGITPTMSKSSMSLSFNRGLNKMLSYIG